MFSPDIGNGLAEFRYGWHIGGSLEMITPDEALGRYAPGQIWEVRFVYDRPRGARIPTQCYQNGYCTDVYNLKIAMGDEYSEVIKEFGMSWLDGAENTTVIPKGLVVFPDTLQVMTDNPYNR
jgi:hypothetical protein